MNISEKLQQEFNIRALYADNVIKLIDEGNTIPFIARYRKEMHGNLDDQTLRAFADRLAYLRNLEKRKEEVSANISEQGKMTEEIVAALSAAATLTEVEDIYRPFKQKKKTRATVAIAKGLEPLADIIMAQAVKTGTAEELALPFIDAEKGVDSAAEALSGAKDIIAERISDNAELRKKLRNLFTRQAFICSKLVKDGENAATYDMYKDYSEPISEIKSHRVLALNRGEQEGCLRVRIDFDKAFGTRICAASSVRPGSVTTALVEEAAADAYERLIFPSIEREVRSQLTDAANEQAIKMFEVNLRPLLMQPPLKNKIVLGYDPAYRTGCKLAVVDKVGKVLYKTVIYPTPPKNDVENAAKILKQIIAKYNVDVISIGNGTASKESEIFVAETIKDIPGVSYTVVSEAGASVYSASKLGAEEFPDYDVAERSAVSIARRLQDPLAELIKIDPKSIGVGQYQHDMPEARLDAVLEGVLEDCVNSVGVDLNTASVSLLKFVAGLNSGIAKNIVAYREENGRFTSRRQILKVSKLGEKAFTQCAGFLRIADGEEILDNTAVHPESYESARKLLKLFAMSEEDISNGNVGKLPALIKAAGAEKVAAECGIGVPTMNDIVTEILKPGRDVRDSLPAPVLRKDIMNIDDLVVGMELAGIVRNVADFGAFIDIGVHQDGLVHISEITDRFIKHPSEVLKVGQPVNVRVIGIDKARNRISLSMKPAKQRKNA